MLPGFTWKRHQDPSTNETGGVDGTIDWAERYFPTAEEAERDARVRAKSVGEIVVYDATDHVVKRIRGPRAR